MKGLNLPKERTFIGPALVWKRIAAFVIDLAIINFVVLIPFKGLLSNLIPENQSFSETYRFFSSSGYSGLITSISVVLSILLILYFLLLERKYSQTIGKKLMKLFVVSDTKDMKIWQMIVRNLVLIPIFPFVLLIILDPLFMFFTKTNQRLSEILSKTRVVEQYNL
jgi:uncharacterized RDD family membrane protein YckC|tara:strand:+ start:49818 stop:50315 length:498 start_codon:yes stop_codon:yes gene_type:complete